MFVRVRQRSMQMRMNGARLDGVRMLVSVMGIMSMLMLVSHHRAYMSVALFVSIACLHALTGYSSATCFMSIGLSFSNTHS
jgi:hypothetical protein